MDWGTKSNSRIYANKSARRSAFSTTSSVKPSYWKRFKSKDQSIYELTWDTTSLSFKCPKGSGCRSSLTQILAIYDIAFCNRFANIDTTKDRRERWMFVMYRGDPIWVCTLGWGIYACRDHSTRKYGYKETRMLWQEFSYHLVSPRPSVVAAVWWWPEFKPSWRIDGIFHSQIEYASWWLFFWKEWSGCACLTWRLMSFPT